MLLVFGLVLKIRIYVGWNTLDANIFYCPENYKKEGSKCTYDKDASLELCFEPKYSDDTGGSCLRKCPDSLFASTLLDDQLNYTKADFYRTTIPNYFVEKKTVLSGLCMSCPAGYGPSVDGISCVELYNLTDYRLKCDYYAANQSCEICVSGYKPKADGDCVLFDNSTQKMTPETVLFCHYFTENNTCTHCRETHILNNSQCVPIANASCIQSDGIKCIRCSSQFKEDKGACIRKCLIEQYADANGNCSSCVPGCTCENQAQLCAECQIGYYKKDSSCLKCSEKCEQCSSDTGCTKCNDTLALYKDKKDGSVKCSDDGALTAPNCKTTQPANSYNICTSCNVGYFLHKGRCYFIKDCGDNYHLAKVDPAHDYLAFYDTEISCNCGEKKYFRKASISGLNIGTCEKCHDGALSCVQGPNDDNMSNNASGGIVNDEKQCETKYFCNSASQCKKCTDECLKCDNNDTCSECSIGHGVNSQGKCVACHAGCTNCTDEAFDTCVACDENLTLWNNTCVVPCGAGEYNVSRPAKDGKTERLCESCTDAIRNCSVCHVEYEGGALYQKAGAKTSISCTACANNFFLKSNACVAVNDLIIEAGDDSQRVVVMRSPYFWAIVALLILFFLACIVLSIVCSLQQKRRKDEVKARIADDNFSPRPVGANLQSGGDDDDDDAFSGSDMDAEFSADGPDTQFSDALTDVEEDALSASGFGDSQLDGL